MQAFLPFLLTFDAISISLSQSYGSGKDYEPVNRRANEISSTDQRFVIFAFVWAIAAIIVTVQVERWTGVICPPGLWEHMIPIAQLLMLGMDWMLISHIARSRQDAVEDQKRVWQTLGSAFLSISAILMFFAAFSFVEPKNVRWAFSTDAIVVRDLCIDSIVGSAIIVSAIYLLDTYHAATIGLQVANIAAITHISSKIRDGTFARLWAAESWFLVFPLSIFIILSMVLQFSRAFTGSLTSSNTPISTKFRMTYIAIFAILVTWTATGPYRTHGQDSIQHLIDDGKRASDEWIVRASRSSSLPEAVAVYSERYGIPPPPCFKEWYEFAIEAKSPVIDDYDQINRDLLPFWGISPSLIRKRTTDLIDSGPGISGLIFENGEVRISPNTPGTHRWMMDAILSMTKPFAQWLPDMQIAFNIDDECMVSVPHSTMEALKASALTSRNRLMSRKDLLAFGEKLAFEGSQESTEAEHEMYEKDMPKFAGRSKSMIYYEYVSTTCHPSSNANTIRWWNRKEDCELCAAPHARGGFVSDWELSGNLCHQPDLSHMHGFLEAPSLALISQELLPIFSQGRMHNFADILYPSPWNYLEKSKYDESQSVQWSEKLDTLFWRGSASDGYATHGAWQSFLRARFVHMSSHIFSKPSQLNSLPLVNRIKPSSNSISDVEVAGLIQDSTSQSALRPNVSFVGSFHKCDQRDCHLEDATFFDSLDPSNPSVDNEGRIDFQEHWRHRHLMDMDGAGFSGRLIPFVRSQSLPWRASLFRTWWEERVHAWAHFVPVDVRLHELGRLMEYFGGYGNSDGPSRAEQMAQAGKKWAEQALRKEDMEIYMFRLLLEWGRLVDDRREQLGYRA